MTPRLAPILLAALTLLAAGCGLDDYEKRMDEERVRLKALSDEGKFLGDPLVVPSDPNEPEPEKQPAMQRAQVFLVLPREIQPTVPEEPAKDPNLPPVKEPPTRSGDTDLYRYAGPAGHNVFVAAQIDKTPQEKSPKEVSEKFQREVLTAVRDYWARTQKRLLTYPDPEDVKPLSVTFQPLPAHGKKLPAVEFKKITFDEPKTTKGACQFEAYFHQTEGKRLGIVYQTPLGGGQGIGASLKTVGLGKAADDNALMFRDLQPFLNLKK